jgi:hypothetical protein
VTGRLRILFLALFVAYLAVLAVVLLGPSTQPGEAGVSGMLRFLWRAGFAADVATPERVEVLLNIALLAPFPLLGGVLWPSLTWRDWTAYGFALALGAEMWQGLGFRRPQRDVLRRGGQHDRRLPGGRRRNLAAAGRARPRLAGPRGVRDLTLAQFAKCLLLQARWTHGQEQGRADRRVAR